MSEKSPLVPPGRFIEEQLEARGWTQVVLATVLGVSRQVVSQIVSGRRNIDAELAIALGEALGVPAERFLQLQQDYDLAHARLIVRPNPSRAMRAHLLGNLPIKEMLKRGWIHAKDVSDLEQVEVELARFFGVRSPAEIEVLPHAAKKTATAEPISPTQLVWLYRARAVAQDMLVNRFSPSAAAAALPKLARLLSAPEEARHVPRILTECGIRFVLVEALPSAKIDGVCFWLDGQSPVIGMSMRFDRIDNFWFVLRHELEHVLRGHGRDAAILDAELEGDRAGTGPNVPEEERQANEAAAEFCVPRRELESFIARKQPFFAERDILGFARKLQIHPGLVAGQLQRHTGRYDRFRSYLVSIRSCVAPSAIVDGWGDVAPVGH
jgi:HTH-type transcriptional regulator/antitoxin HigA